MAEPSKLQTASITMPENLYLDEHHILRTSARRFFEQVCAPDVEAWEAEGMVPREIWRKAAELGFLCPTIATEYGGSGGDVRMSTILLEEQTRAGAVGFGLGVHNDVVAPYIEKYGTEAQKARCLPNLASGKWIGAIAMTEPGTGSDLQALRTTAKRDGDNYLVNGQKTFITNGQCADLIILAARTGDGQAARDISLFLFETADAEGFSRGRNLEKLGQKASDTTELFFDSVAVPAGALLGEVAGCGFAQMMERLPYERLMTGVAAVAIMDRALEHTIVLTKERKVFGQAVIDFQNTRFKLAEAKTIATIARVFLDKCLRLELTGRLDAETAAMLKWWTTEKQCQIVDDCLQFHGGYGYILDYPIAKMFVDGRVQKIYGGSNEIMKEIIGRAL